MDNTRMPPFPQRWQLRNRRRCSQHPRQRERDRQIAGRRRPSATGWWRPRNTY